VELTKWNLLGLAKWNWPHVCFIHLEHIAPSVVFEWWQSQFFFIAESFQAWNHSGFSTLDLLYLRFVASKSSVPNHTIILVTVAQTRPSIPETLLNAWVGISTHLPLLPNPLLCHSSHICEEYWHCLDEWFYIKPQLLLKGPIY